MTDWDNVDFGEITCQEFVELVTEYLEDELRPAARARFEQHLEVCPGCERYLDQIREARRTLGQVTVETISAGARDQLLSAFRSWRSARPDGGSSAP
ncbi:MAG: anti-sigma factor [Actinomycetota bacterium]